MSQPTIFSNAQLAKLVADTVVPQTDPAHTHVVVGTVDQQGAQVVASFKKSGSGAGWELQAAARHDWSGDNSVGGRVILKW